jgi:hypothetical protein
MPWPRYPVIVRQKRSVIYRPRQWPNPTLLRIQRFEVDSSHAAVIAGVFPVTHGNLNNLQRHTCLQVLTKPPGTVTLARPTSRSVSRLTPVVGFQIAALLAGHTIPLHCSLRVLAVGAYEPACDSWSSRCALYVSRTFAASSCFSTPSDYVGVKFKQVNKHMQRRTIRLSSYCLGTDFLARIV